MHAGCATGIFLNVSHRINPGTAHMAEVALHDNLLFRAAEKDVPNGGISDLLKFSRMAMKTGAKSFGLELVSDFIHLVREVLDHLFVFGGIIREIPEETRGD